MNGGENKVVVVTREEVATRMEFKINVETIKLVSSSSDWEVFQKGYRSGRQHDVKIRVVEESNPWLL